MFQLAGHPRIKCWVSDNLACRIIQTYIFLERALRFQCAIDLFAARQEFRAYELNSHDWEAITKVAEWLSQFRDATTKMSATKSAVLSLSFGYFIRLQNKLQSILDTLLPGEHSQLRDGLLAAHEKLADYLFRFTVSPYYIWASCKLYVTPISIIQHSDCLL